MATVEVVAMMATMTSAVVAATGVSVRDGGGSSGGGSGSSGGGGGRSSGYGSDHNQQQDFIIHPQGNSYLGF